MMRQTEIAIVGGGLAGSAAAAMLCRSGIDALLIDPHEEYPPDFRCEKLDGSQLEILVHTGLAEAVLPNLAVQDEVWVARFGRLVEKRPQRQYGFRYDRLVNSVRSLVPHERFIAAKAVALHTGEGQQRLTLSTGDEVSARLVVMANGLNSAVRQNLGMTRRDWSPCHSISIGFDLQPAGRKTFDFQALTYHPERAADRFAYLSIFPVGTASRANFFVYRDMRDPWLRQMREAPRETLLAAMPGLRPLIGDFDVPDVVKIRPVDLYQTEGYLQPGVVLIGDAFATSCPAAGTGTNKVLTDVERLCNHHVSGWLATPGMGVEKIARFYNDPVKQACDAHSAERAVYLRTFSTNQGALWRARRLVRFGAQVGRGALRTAHGRLFSPAVQRPSTMAPGSSRP